MIQRVYLRNLKSCILYKRLFAYLIGRLTMQKYGILYKKSPKDCLKYFKENNLNARDFIVLHQSNKDKWKQLLDKPVDKSNIIGITQETLSYFNNKFYPLPDFPPKIILMLLTRLYKFEDDIITAFKIVLRTNNISHEQVIKFNSQVCGIYNKLEKEQNDN